MEAIETCRTWVREEGMKVVLSREGVLVQQKWVVSNNLVASRSTCIPFPSLIEDFAGY